MKITGSLYMMGALLVLVLALGCGGRQGKEGEQKKSTQGQTAEGQASSEKEAVDKAQKQIRNWMGTELAQKVSKLGKDLGKEIGVKIAANGQVMGGLKGLSKAVLEEPTVKPKLKEIESRATKGFGNKLTLGLKALKAGGIDEFKAKVAADAQRVAVDVLTAHVKNQLLKDERLAALMKDLTPVLKIQATMAAMSIQENLSPTVTKKVLGIALRIASAKNDPNVAKSVDEWIEKCEGDEEVHLAKLVRDISSLKSMEEAIAGLATEVLGHERTKKELVQMMNALIGDKEVNAALEKVYSAAAFEKGDDEIRTAIEKVIAFEIVDRELFAALERLAAAEGAGPMIGKHLKKVSDDPALAQIVEDFVIGLLETCGNL